jgi:hypothetical protein
MSIRQSLRDRMVRRILNGHDGQQAEARRVIDALDAGGDVVVTGERLKGAVYENGDTTAAEVNALVDGPAPRLYVLHADDTYETT